MINQAEDLTFSSLDPSQKNTFNSIINDDDSLHIVHGPPGTGKSQLVVSLLEGLASKGKKVLFISQNTEALKVIERMILKTQKEIGYSSDSKYLSLLDFCLMLYNPKHKQLKYLREQNSNLSGKQLPVVHVTQKPFDVDFSLRYTNLDHNANYSIEGAEVGFDELVRYFIKYVNQVIAPEPLRELDSIDIRAVFRELDEYQNRDRFSEYNRPKRELVLLSSKRSEITLPSVRSSLQDIKSAISGEWTQLFASKEDIDILDYLNHLKEYTSLRQYFDVYRISTEEVDIIALKNSFKDLIDTSDNTDTSIAKLREKSKNLTSSMSLDIHGVSFDMSPVVLNQTTLELVHNDTKVVINDKDRIARLISELTTKHPDIQHASIFDVWVGMRQGASIMFNKLVNDLEAEIGNKAVTGLLEKMNDLTKEQLLTINQDIIAFSDKISQMGAIKRMMASVPPSLKQRFNLTLVGDFEKFKNKLGLMLSLSPSLMGEDERLGEALAYTGEKHIPLQKLNISPPTNIESMASELAIVNELVRLLQKYEIEYKDFASMKHELVTLHKSLLTLTAVGNNEENRRLFISSSMQDIIQSTNTAIEVELCAREINQLEEKRRDQWNEAYNLYKSIVIGVESTGQFEKKVAEIYTYLNHKSEQIPKALRAIAVPDRDVIIDANFEVIESTLLDANSTDNFSDEFFELRAGGTIRKWLDTISVLETYNNDIEIMEYTSHNKSLVNIKNALGAANVKYIDSILSNDVSFETFAARLVNALVGEVFGRASSKQRVRISTKDLLDEYEKYLKSQRVNSYSATLRQLHSKTMAITRELSKQSTLQAAGKSTMDKFRYNTVSIAEAFPIICATPKDVAKYIAPLRATFDYVIFDEASQLLPGQALPSIYRAKKAVIIGDPHQMPPNLNASFSLVEQSEDEFDDLGESILDLVKKQPMKEHHLKVHYRSRYNKLFEPSRRAIYSADGIEPIFEAELARGAPIDILDDLGDELDEYGYDKNFAKVCQAVEGYVAQDAEADFCVLFTTGGVLQQFRSYIEEVGHREYKNVATLYDQDKILLSTVTNCQGIEGAYTILYMHHYSRPGAMWFFKEQAGAYKRLNVSITRQREGLKLLLADPRAHWIAACDQKINSESTGPNAALSAQLMRSLLTNAGEQADESYLDRTLGSNVSWFDSPLTEQLYDKLTEHYGSKIGRDIKIYSEVGWNLVIPKGGNIEDNERNVGFRIDLGIYSPLKKKFVLGIEMDGAMYHSGYEKEHSDYTRQKVLEAKGWDIYRIWSTNWLMDTDREFSKLTQQIDKAISVDV